MLILFKTIIMYSPKYIPGESSSTLENVLRRKWPPQQRAGDSNRRRTGSKSSGSPLLRLCQHFPQWNQGKAMRGNKTV